MVVEETEERNERRNTETSDKRTKLSFSAGSTKQKISVTNISKERERAKIDVTELVIYIGNL